MISPPPPTLVWWYKKRFLIVFWDLVTQEQCLEDVRAACVEQLERSSLGCGGHFWAFPCHCGEACIKPAPSAAQPPAWLAGPCLSVISRELHHKWCHFSSQCRACSEVNWCLSPMAWPKFWCSVISSFLVGQALVHPVLKVIETWADETHLSPTKGSILTLLTLTLLTWFSVYWGALTGIGHQFRLKQSRAPASRPAPHQYPVSVLPASSWLPGLYTCSA